MNFMTLVPFDFRRSRLARSELCRSRPRLLDMLAGGFFARGPPISANARRLLGIIELIKRSRPLIERL